MSPKQNSEQSLRSETISTCAKKYPCKSRLSNVDDTNVIDLVSAGQSSAAAPVATAAATTNASPVPYNVLSMASRPPKNPGQRGMKASSKTAITPKSTDVFLGRGKLIQSHPGNIAYLKVIRKHKKDYIKLRKEEKRPYAEQLLKMFLDTGVRFLRCTTPEEEKKRKKHDQLTWEEVDFELACNKLSHGLREKTGERLSSELEQRRRKMAFVSALRNNGRMLATPTMTQDIARLQAGYPELLGTMPIPGMMFAGGLMGPLEDYGSFLGTPHFSATETLPTTTPDGRDQSMADSKLSTSEETLDFAAISPSETAESMANTDISPTKLQSDRGADSQLQAKTMPATSHIRSRLLSSSSTSIPPTTMSTDAVVRRALIQEVMESERMLHINQLMLEQALKFE